MKIIKLVIVLLILINVTACTRYTYVPDDIPNVISEKDASILFCQCRQS